jgi:hypothetical protein
MNRTVTDNLVLTARTGKGAVLHRISTKMSRKSKKHESETRNAHFNLTLSQTTWNSMACHLFILLARITHHLA